LNTSSNYHQLIATLVQLPSRQIELGIKKVQLLETSIETAAQRQNLQKVKIYIIISVDKGAVPQGSETAHMKFTKISAFRAMM